MKKLIALTLTVIMGFIMSTTAFALKTNSVIPTTTLNKILTDYRNALKAGDKYVSLSQYGVSGSVAENELYEFFYRADAELGSISYGRYCDTYATPYIESSSGSIKGVSIDYWERYKKDDGSCDMDHVRKDQETVYERFSAAKLIVKRTMSDAEKALVLYDYIIAQTNYPLSESIDENGEEEYSDEVRTVVSLLCDGYAVCTAYAKLYAILLNDAGIKAVTVDCDSMKHEWVMAQIDGEWYHCDPTWDDYLFTSGFTVHRDLNDDSWDKGAAGHYFFLKSDEEFIEHDHPYWNLSDSVNPDYLTKPPTSGKSGAFDDKFFSPENENYQCCTLMNYINGSWYFVDMKTQSIVNASYDGSAEYIALPADESPKYSFGYGNYLYVCTTYSVLRYDTMSGSFEKILKVPDKDSTTDDFSEMSIINDEMTVVKAHYTYDENNESVDATFDNMVYPMSEVENMTPIIDDMNDDNDGNGVSVTREPESDPNISISRPGGNSSKNNLSKEEKAMLEEAQTSGKRMMAIVYLAIASVFIIIALVAIILTIKYIRKK